MERLYIHNNIRKFGGDHILIKFFKKKRLESDSLKADKQLNAFLRSS